MNRQPRSLTAISLTLLGALVGCTPIQPYYLHEDGDLSHYLERATQIEHPDVEAAGLPDAHMAEAPLTVANSEFAEKWNLTLEEAVAIALQNSKVIRASGQVSLGGLPGSADAFVTQPQTTATVYDPALQESSVGSELPLGVEAALSDFDALFTTNVFWNKTDRPQNTTGIFTGFNPAVLQQDLGTFEAGITKKAATGTTFSFRNSTTHDVNNRTGSRTFPSDWFTAFEMEVNQPLLRGAGTQVNRIPVVLARIRTDVSLADFEAAVRNLVMDVENAYWDLATSYRALDASKLGRDSAHNTWQKIKARVEGGDQDADREAQAREQYYSFRGQVEASLSDLFATENRLRFLLGLAATDGRLICPIDEPTTAKVSFPWTEILCETLVRSVEVRKQKWQIERRELELIAARNNLLPQLDLTALYRWQGLGDRLITTEGVPDDGSVAPRFLQPGSTAFDSLLSGDYTDFRVGLEMRIPVGFRAELAGVRNAQLNAARERARLEDMELGLSHLLSDAVRRLDLEYEQMQTNFNRWAAAKRQVEAIVAKQDLDEMVRNVDLLLDAQRRMADAQQAYYRSLSNYNKSIAFIHFRKGSLLEYDNVYLAEGPWPAKAYWDALGRARERDASQYLDYGWSRPRVISQGEVPQQGYHADGAYFESEASENEVIETPLPSEGGEPTPAVPPAMSSPPKMTGTPRPAAGPGGNRSPANAAFAWGELGLPPTGGRTGPVRTVANQAIPQTRNEPHTYPPARAAYRPASGGAGVER